MIATAVCGGYIIRWRLKSKQFNACKCLVRVLVDEDNEVIYIPVYMYETKYCIWFVSGTTPQESRERPKKQMLVSNLHSGITVKARC